MYGSSLHDLMRPRAYPEYEVHRLMVPIFDAVIYCHNYGVSHQDLKPSKILLTSTDLETATIKISSFGMKNFQDPYTVLSSE
jgi:serine/threonine protein kinase